MRRSAIPGNGRSVLARRGQHEIPGFQAGAPGAAQPAEHSAATVTDSVRISDDPARRLHRTTARRNGEAATASGARREKAAAYADAIRAAIIAENFSHEPAARSHSPLTNIA